MKNVFYRKVKDKSSWEQKGQQTEHCCRLQPIEKCHQKIGGLSRAKLSNLPVFYPFPWGFLASRRHLSCSQRYICLTAARRQIRPEVFMQSRKL